MECKKLFYIFNIKNKSTITSTVSTISITTYTNTNDVNVNDESITIPQVDI